MGAGIYNHSGAGKVGCAKIYHRDVVERVDAEGADLRTPEAVFDTVALHITAEIGSTIGGRMAAADTNDLARQGLATDPDTGRNRNYTSQALSSSGMTGMASNANRSSQARSSA